MRQVTKRWLLLAAFLTALGIILFGVVMTMLKWNFGKLSTVKLERNEHEIREDFQDVLVKTDTA